MRLYQPQRTPTIHTKSRAHTSTVFEEEEEDQDEGDKNEGIKEQTFIEKRFCLCSFFLFVCVFFVVLLILLSSHVKVPSQAIRRFGPNRFTGREGRKKERKDVGFRRRKSLYEVSTKVTPLTHAHTHTHRENPNFDPECSLNIRRDY